MKLNQNRFGIMFEDNGKKTKFKTMKNIKLKSNSCKYSNGILYQG